MENVSLPRDNKRWVSWKAFCCKSKWFAWLWLMVWNGNWRWANIAYLDLNVYSTCNNLWVLALEQSIDKLRPSLAYECWMRKVVLTNLFSFGTIVLLCHVYCFSFVNVRRFLHQAADYIGWRWQWWTAALLMAISKN